VPLQYSANSKEFIEILGNLNKEIELSGKENLTSLSVSAENFYRDLLNELFEWHLRNVNETEQNAAGIDLIDDMNALVVQVTSTCSKQKMEDTLRNKALVEYAQKGYEIRFVFIGKANENARTWKLSNPYSIRTDKNNGVLLTQDLVHRFIYMALDSQDKVIELLYKETGRKFFIRFEDVNTRLAASLKELQDRYNPALNISTDSKHPFDSLMDSASFREKLGTLVPKCANDLNKLIENATGKAQDDLAVKDIVSCGYELRDCLAGYREDDDEGRLSDWLKKNRSLAERFETVCDAILFSGICKNADGDQILNAKHQTYQLEDFMDEYMTGTLSGHRLLVIGDGGIGKTHLLADFCNETIESGNLAFLFLGQHFFANEEPWRQILNYTCPGISPREFLSEVARYANSHSRKAVIVIDALNEGEGKKIWKNQMQRFLAEFDDFPEIRIVLSVRTSDLPTVLDEGMIAENGFFTLKCKGFENVECDALHAYCQYYGLAEPVLPFLPDEFANPLFLKIACASASERGLAALSARCSLTDVVNDYLISVNKRLAAADYLDYDSNIDLVKRAVTAIVTCPGYSFGRLQYASAAEAVNSVVREYCSNSGRFLRALVDENVLYSNVDYEGKKVVGFTYERIGDFIEANEVITGFISSIDNYTKQGNLKVESDNPFLALSRGGLEAAAIILPDRSGFELFDVMPDDYFENGSNIAMYFGSFPWRKIEALTDSMKMFLDDHASYNEYVLNDFLSALLKLAFEPGNALNAEFLDRLLRKNPLRIRDGFWTSFISLNGELERSIEWMWEHYASIPEESIFLCELLLAWCFTATNRRLRDCATKTLSCIIDRHPEGAEVLLSHFFECDDDYVIERLYAAVCGSVLRLPDNPNWLKLLPIIYQHIFDADETFPHVLVRDYAYTTMDCILRANPDVDSDIYPRYKPPYKSTWAVELVPDEEIDQLVESVTAQYEEHSVERLAVSILVSSMTTEYGRGGGYYGDFGRYVFGTMLDEWHNQFENDQLLANAVIKWILEDPYEIEFDAKFDVKVKGAFSAREHPDVERLGKKYQWIGMHRLLARLVDNYRPYTEEIVYSDDYNKYLDRSYKAFQESIKTGNFKKAISPNDEKYSNPKDFIVSIEKHDFEDKDIWNCMLDLRDIDPTYIRKDDSAQYGKEQLVTDQISLAEEGWLDGPIDNNDLYELRFPLISGRPYVVLNSNIKQTNSNSKSKELKSFSWLTSACFIADQDMKEYRELCGSHDNHGVPCDRYACCFLFDCFSGPAYISQIQMREKESNDSLGFIIPATQEYWWGAYEDRSLKEDEGANVLLPSQALAEAFCLKQIGRGVWATPENNRVCFDSTSMGYTDHELLFDWELLKEYLHNKGLGIVWSDYIETRCGKRRHRRSWVVCQQEQQFLSECDEDEQWENDFP